LNSSGKMQTAYRRQHRNAIILIYWCPRPDSNRDGLTANGF
jgi:hypothetical protein